METTMLTSSHPDLGRRISMNSLLLSVAMLLAGFLFLMSILRLDDRSSTLSMALMVTGTVLLLWGTFRFFWKTKEYVYLPTGSVTKKETYFFNFKDMKPLQTFLENGTWCSDAGIRCEASGNVRMDIISSQDGRFIAVQLLQFVPYAYTPVTSVHYYVDAEAARVIRFLNSCKQG